MSPIRYNKAFKNHVKSESRDYLLIILVTTKRGSITLPTRDVRLISSANWPDNYANRVDDWTLTIHSPGGTGIRLDVLDLSLNKPSFYLDDVLAVYDGEILNYLSKQ